MIHEAQIILNRGDYTTCSINVVGGTVTSWRIQHEEQLFASRENHYEGLARIRGGCNIAFPQFGYWNMGAPHGFSRDMAWAVEEGPGKLKNGDIWLIMSLNADSYTDSMYNYNFKLMYKITLCEYKLIFNIYVENISKYYPLEYQIVHHCSFRVPNVNECKIIGFRNCHFEDRETGMMDVEDREFLSISERIDRLYKNVPKEYFITNMVNGGTMRATREGTRDVNIWNPGNRKGIRHLGDDEYQYFIAVEAGRVMNPIRIEPLTCWQARHTYEIIPKKERKQVVVDDFYDLFNDYC